MIFLKEFVYFRTHMNFSSLDFRILDLSYISDDIIIFMTFLRLKVEKSFTFMSLAFQNGRWGNWFALKGLVHCQPSVLMLRCAYVSSQIHNTSPLKHKCSSELLPNICVFAHFLADVSGQMCCHPAGVGWANRWLIGFQAYSYPLIILWRKGRVQLLWHHHTVHV